MSVGLIALIDDITALAKLAVVSLDDTATQAAKASSKAISKATGIIIDDAAVTPRYVVGLAAKRELPIIGKIALGSLKNKLVLLLPGALLLSYFAPWSITPLLMIGGMFLCYEGWHKLADTLNLHPKMDADTKSEILKSSIENLSATELEDQRVSSAIRTDFILSAEIMAITLSTISTLPAWMQGVVLAVSGLAMTFIVYAAVALIVKADDFCAYLALQSSGLIRNLGKLIVLGMPIFLQLLSHVGMIAMLWVGGGIITHGLHVLGVHSPEDWINKSGDAVILYTGNFGSWIVKAGLTAILGLIVGAIVELVSKKVILPSITHN